MAILLVLLLVYGLSSAELNKLMEPNNLISSQRADRIAVSLGRHPLSIWTDWFDEEPEEGSNPKVIKKRLRPNDQKPCHVDLTNV